MLQRYRGRNRGEITIFLAVIVSLILIFIVCAIESVRRHMVKSEIALAVDTAIKSCFGEYNRELYERYHLMFIDSSYKGNTSGVEYFREHFVQYLDMNLGMTSSLGENGTPYLSVKSANVESMNSAIDAGYRDIYRMGVEYGKEVMSSKNVITDSKEAFLSYLSKVVGTYENPSYKNVRTGEIEYILFGMEYDADNIDRAMEEYEEFLLECKELRLPEETYNDFLFSELEKMDMGIVKRRFGRIVTEYMKKNGSPAFCLEDCYSAVRIDVLVQSNYGMEYSVRRDYSYL